MKWTIKKIIKALKSIKKIATFPFRPRSAKNEVWKKIKK